MKPPTHTWVIVVYNKDGKYTMCYDVKNGDCVIDRYPTAEVARKRNSWITAKHNQGKYAPKLVPKSRVAAREAFLNSYRTEDERMEEKERYVRLRLSLAKRRKHKNND